MVGEIPSHWELQPGRAYLKPQKVKNTGNKVSTVLSLSYGKIVIKPEEKLHGLVPESFETYQIVEPGNPRISSFYDPSGLDGDKARVSCLFLLFN